MKPRQKIYWYQFKFNIGDVGCVCVCIYRVILSLEAPNKFGKSIPEFGETHSSVLGCERRPVSVSIMSRSRFASFFSF